ncbi:hypothetical protein CASFOL_013729 [Castilleja foliolosa]|uniref:Ubiquitin-like protease family profile domain-containing protein n=1 Tax=Castilleja foliolosa TaxID=1961234 RepID=A0ABD3DM07_9LAMI
MASADNTVDNNNMAIQLYEHPQVGETAAAADSNPTNAVDSTTANPSDSSNTISNNNNNADSTTGWKWRWPNIRNEEGRRSSLLLDVKRGLIEQIWTTLEVKVLDRFRASCFGAYLHYPNNLVPSAVMHLMISQQVIKEGAEEDELWFLVGDKFVRLSKYEYALVTGLRFGPTNFDPNADCECSEEGVFRKFVDPENKYGKKGAPYTDVLKLFKKPPRVLRRSPQDLLKIAKVLFVHGYFYAIDTRTNIAKWLWVLVEDEKEWEKFPWGAYSFQIFIMRMKNLKAGERSYHFYGFSHAFLHFVFEAVPGLAAKVTSKPKHGLVQPRLIKRLFHKCSSLDEIVKFFDSKEPIECYEKLEPTESELSQYTWWGHVADDVRSSVKYIHRESHFTGKAKELKRTREQSPVPEREQGDGSVPTVETGPRNNSVPALELRPTKRTRTTESPNVDSEELLTSILEGVRRDNELLVQRVMREVREIQEMASRKADDMKSEIEEFKKIVEELRRRDSYVPFEDYAQFENTPSPSPAKETPSPPPPPPEIQKTRSPPPSVRTPSPPEFLKTTPADEVFVPFEDDFLDEIAAFTDNMEYARVRGVREPSATPILRVPVQTGKPFSPIRVTTAAMMKQQEKAKDSVFRVRPAVRPPKDSDEAFVLSDRHREQISSYIAYLSSYSEEARDIGNIFPETAAFFKEIEDYTKTMEIQVVDAYLRILNFSPEFLGCHPEGKGKFTILGHFFCENIDNIFRKKYPREIIPDGLKGKAEKLNLRDEQVNTLLNIVLGKTTVITEKWGPLVPFTEVQKIYTVWLASGHFYPLIIDLVRCEVWIFDSMAICTDKAQRKNRYLKTLSLRRILPAILKASGFYRVRKDLKPVFREWDLRFAVKDYCFRQEDILSCGPFALKMMEVLVSRRALPYITEKNIGLIRSSIAERIFSYSKPAKTNVPLL